MGAAGRYLLCTLSQAFPSGTDGVLPVFLHAVRMAAYRGADAMTTQCPHCRGQVANDASLAGQAVQCPHCRQQFTMPALATVRAVKPPVASSGPAVPMVDTSAKPTSTLGSRYRKRKQSVPPIYWILGGLGLLVFSCCGGLGIIGALNPAKPSNSVPETSGWDMAWESLPKEADGTTDWKRVDRIDIDTAYSYDYKAGVEIERQWKANNSTSSGDFRGDYGIGASSDAEDWKAEKISRDTGIPIESARGWNEKSQAEKDEIIANELLRRSGID